jgi:hypothetical protein
MSIPWTESVSLWALISYPDLNPVRPLDAHGAHRDTSACKTSSHEFRSRIQCEVAIFAADFRIRNSDQPDYTLRFLLAALEAEGKRDRGLILDRYWE